MKTDFNITSELFYHVDFLMFSNWNTARVNDYCIDNNYGYRFGSRVNTKLSPTNDRAVNIFIEFDDADDALEFSLKYSEFILSD